MKLWLDDVRPAPDGWIWARSVEQAKSIVELAGRGVRSNTLIEEMSLDHDLGVIDLDLYLKSLEENQIVPEGHEANELFAENAPTGYDFVYWLAEQSEANGINYWPTKGIVVHSMNNNGARRMCGVVDRYGPYDKPCPWRPASEIEY